VAGWAAAAARTDVVGFILHAGRELARFGTRVMTIAPGLFLTQIRKSLPEQPRQSMPVPQRLGTSEAYAVQAIHILANHMLNGETTCLYGALRIAPN